MARSLYARGRPSPKLRLPANLGPLEDLIPILGSRSVVVVGSAPLLRPLRLHADDVVMTVNGSLSSVEGVPAVHLINARVGPHVTWNRDRRALNAAMVAQLAHRAIGVLALLPVQEVGAEDAFLARLAAQGTTWSSAVTIVKSSKVALAHSVGALHRESDRHLSLSAGLLAVVLALWAGAARVRTEGFSFDAGYAYLPPDAVPANARGHLRGDKTAIGKLLELYPGRIVGDLFTRRREQKPRHE